MVGRHMAAQAGPGGIVGLAVDGAVLMEEGHQVAPAVGDENIERDELCYQVFADAA